MTYSLSAQMKWSWWITTGYRIKLFVFFFLELLVVALSLSFVYWSKLAVDIAMQDADGSLRTAVFIVAGTAILGVVVQLLATQLNERIRVKLLIKLQGILADNQMMSTWGYMKDLRTGDLLVRLNNDASEVISMIVSTGPTFFITIVKLISSFGFLWVMDPMLAWMILAISPLFVFSKIYVRRSRKLNVALKESESELSNVLQENFKLRMLIRGMGLAGFRKGKLEQTQGAIFALKIRQLNFSLFTQGIMKLAMNAGYLLTFIWGIYRLHTLQISVGTMTAFLQLVGRIQSPLISVMTFIPSFLRFRTALDRVLMLFHIDKEEEKEPVFLKHIERIKINDLQFSYAEDLIIDRFSAELKKGIPTAVLGSSGKGKTTLVRLLLSLIYTDLGCIEIESEKGMQRLSSAHRVNFAYVPQGNTLFSGTIRENIMVDSPVEDEEVIREALSTACAEFVYKLPNGLDTELGEAGFGLSEGQAQRIAIARALIKGCDILIFDEATSALDTSTSFELIQKLMVGGKNKILIFVTHDLSLAQQCGQTIFMN